MPVFAPDVDLTQVEDVRRAVQEAATDGPLDSIVSLWTQTCPHTGSEASVAALHLLQMPTSLDRPPRLRLVTRGAQQVLANDRPEPGLAAVWGLGKVAAVELPHLDVTLVDLDPAVTDTDGATRLLLAELLADNRSQPLVAHRTGSRYVPGTITLTPAGTTAPRMRPDATYLVTGGTGGVGRHTARHLPRLGARHLALLSRGGPGRRSPPGVRRRVFVISSRRSGIALPTDVCRPGERRSLNEMSNEELVVGVALEEPQPTMRPLEFVRGLLC